VEDAGTDRDRIRAYYAGTGEGARLDSAAGELELARTLELVERRVEPPARVLDLGGGPGRETIELARRGYRVTLADLSPELVDEARGRIAAAGLVGPAVSLHVADAVDLAVFADATFDAVLAAGPFYHLVHPSERERAADELRRVLRPGGLAFVAFLPRLSGLAALIERAARDPEQVSAAAWSACRARGAFVNGTPRGFQEGWYAEPDELRALFAARGFEALELVTLRGLAYRYERELAQLEPDLREAVLRTLRETEADPHLVATAGHALLIGRRS